MSLVCPNMVMAVHLCEPCMANTVMEAQCVPLQHSQIWLQGEAGAMLAAHLPSASVAVWSEPFKCVTCWAELKCQNTSCQCDLGE